MKTKTIKNHSEQQLIISEELFEKVKISPTVNNKITRPVKKELNPLWNSNILPWDWIEIDLLLGKLSIDELNELNNKFNESKNRNGKSYWSKSLKKQVHFVFEKYSIPISNSLTTSSADFEALKYLF